MEQPKKTIHDESDIEIPEEIRDIGFDFPRDLNKLHALELSVEELEIKELEWHLDLPFFWDIDKPFSIRPRDVIENPEKYEYRYRRIMSVDISYPIDVMFWNGKWEILDGLHRLCQHIINRKGDTVLVRKVPIEWKERIMPDYALK